MIWVTKSQNITWWTQLGVLLLANCVSLPSLELILGWIVKFSCMIRLRKAIFCPIFQGRIGSMIWVGFVSPRLLKCVSSLVRNCIGLEEVFYCQIVHKLWLSGTRYNQYTINNLDLYFLRYNPKAPQEVRIESSDTSQLHWNGSLTAFYSFWRRFLLKIPLVFGYFYGMCNIIFGS